MMNSTTVFWAIIVAGVVTILTRVTPFLVLDRGQESPKWVLYLGKVLPSAVMSVLLIYCIRGIDVTKGSRGIPELVGVAVAMILHAWKGNTLLSICASAILYMILVQLVFI